MPFTGEAAYKHGNVLSVDHTPSGAVAAGEVIVIGDIPFVAHLNIAADELGAISSSGGVYECTTDGSLDTGGALVYWDDTTNEAVAAGTGFKHFGYTVPDQGATIDQDKVLVIHAPNRIPSL